MKKFIFAGFLAATVAFSAHADLKVFATVPEWGALAKEIGGDKVRVPGHQRLPGPAPD